ncbi:hypothetical protein FPT33_22825 [Salmonella enterica]|nr:hypothetical protein [Salmonella enterica]
MTNNEYEKMMVEAADGRFKIEAVDAQIEAHQAVPGYLNEHRRELITSIPKLIETHGTLADTCRETGLNEMTLSKYRHDTKCEQHVIYNNRLMTHTKTSPVIYTKRGVSRNDRMKLEGLRQ